MRNDASRLKYLAFVLSLGACLFDPQATGPGNQSNPQATDGSAAGTEGGAGQSSGTGGSGGAAADSGGSSGTGTTTGTAGTGVVAGAGGMSTAGSGGMAPPPLLVNGALCDDDARCMSGHCDVVCCDKGVECCRTVDDCSVQPDGLGKSCDDRANCHGTIGKIECRDNKCMTLNGQRSDIACVNTTEANDCGLYPAVFCLGGELQSGAPPCATSCVRDTDCDEDAHCDDGKCVQDLGNGEHCKRREDCAQGYCNNIRNGVGVCCGALGDCCKVANDCPDKFREAPVCKDTQTCSGGEIVAQCNGNICSSSSINTDVACNGMPGPTCGLYKDIVCMAGRNNSCKTSCSNMGDCDSNAYCDAGRCVEKLTNGKSCAMGNQCMNGNCTNGVCCNAGKECCRTDAQCTMNLDAKCDNEAACQGSRRSVMCGADSACDYGPNDTGRVQDDRPCTSAITHDCGLFKAVRCNGQPEQPGCPTKCTSNADCVANAQCGMDGMCQRGIGSGSGTGGNSGASGTNGGPGGP